jgi:hypothetical protein
MRRIWLPFALLAALAPLARAADFSGTYENNEDGTKTVLTLAQSGSDLTGTVESDGIKMAVTGKADGDKAEGSAVLNAEGVTVTLYFRATLSGDRLTMKISDDRSFSEAEDVVFVRTSGGGGGGQGGSQGGGQGGAQAGTETASPFKKAPSELLANGEEYTHASGGKFRLPKGWRVQEAEGYLQLVPPDPGQGELIIINSESAEGATDPGSPEVLAYLDGQLASVMPDARRVGKPERLVAGAGKGVVLDWQGTAEGRKVKVRGYVTILQGKGVALVIVGNEGQVSGRDATLRSIFATVGWGQGKTDQSLVGTWNHWSYKGSSDYSYSRETKITVTLGADGTFNYQNGSETQMGGGTYGTAGNHSLYARGGNGWSGRWTADGSTLILHFEDGTTEEFSYRFEQQGANTFLVTEPAGGDGKNKMEWSRG